MNSLAFIIFFIIASIAAACKGDRSGMEVIVSKKRVNYFLLTITAGAVFLLHH